MTRALSLLSLAALLALLIGASIATATAPVVTIEPAAEVAYTTATAKGTVNPEDKETSYRFQYVSQAQFEVDGWAKATSVGQGTLPPGAGVSAVQTSISGLKPATVYQLRLLAENEDGAVEALAATFETKAVAKPIVSTVSVSAVDHDSASFSATANPNAPEAAPVNDPLVEDAFRTNWGFQCTPGCSSPSGTLEADNQAQAVKGGVEFLQPNTPYKVKLLATNAGGTAESAEAEFKTQAIAPTVARVASTPLGPGEVGLGARVNPHNSALSDCHLEYGPTESYGTSVPCDPAPPTNNSPTLVGIELSGLTPGATYHARLQATNGVGTTTSEDAVFAALAEPEAQSCANPKAPGAGFLPGCRAWEMVSPADKNGGYIVPSSSFTRAAADGSAVGFNSLALFADAVGTGINTTYVARRSSDPDPGTNGWATHAINPEQDPNTYKSLLSSAFEPRYVGDFSADLQRGVFFAKSPLTADPDVAEVVNLYRRSDLLSPGAGSYQLLSACPHCAKTNTPLPPLPGPPNDSGSINFRPELAGASPDLERLIFESQQRLSTDTPEPFTGRIRLYEWEDGAVRLAGRIPKATAIECDDANGPACVAAPVSIGGHGVDTGEFLTPHTVSDGSDGHSRVFFTAPTDAGGAPVPEGLVGNGYVRSDASATAKLNASERDEEPADKFAPAAYFDATPDGRFAYFTTAQALTDDAPADNQSKLYSYDTTKPASAPDNLTLLSPDGEPKDSGEALGLIGTSEDGAYAYFVADGQLVAGELGGGQGIYLWHGGELRFIGPTSNAETEGSTTGELLSTGKDQSPGFYTRQARVTPDGRRLLFSSVLGKDLLSRYGGTDYDHGACGAGYGAPGCRELYLYSADSDSLQCASCRPDGGPSATVFGFEELSSTFAHTLSGGAGASTHLARALSEDGRFVFFSTPQKLVPEDTNGVFDAYVYDARTGEPSLLSGGEDSSRSWFMDAASDGSNAFFVTRERLTGWDIGSDYDLYDARVGGGFPEPPPAPPGCVGDACQPAPASLENPNLASVGFQGPGDRSQPKPPLRCRKGQRKVKRRGKPRCVKRGRAKR